MNTLGIEIKKLRKSMKITQKELAKGICTQATISLIEKGKLTPSVEILSPLSNNLGVSISQLIEIAQYENFEIINKYINNIEDALENHDYKKVYNYSMLRLEVHNDEKWFEIYLEWVNLFSGYFININSFEDTIRRLKILYKQTLFLYNKKEFVSIRILNSIAILYAMHTEFKKAVFYFNKIHIDFDSQNFSDPKEYIYRLKIIYNKSKIYYEMLEFSNSLAQAEEGIKISLKKRNIDQLPNFYYYMAKNQIKLNYNHTEISESIVQCVYFFDLLGKKSHLKLVLDEIKSNNIPIIEKHAFIIDDIAKKYDDKWGG